MRTLLRAALPFLIIAPLTACNGAGGPSSEISPTTPPPTVPASTEIADLIAFADSGTKSRIQFRDNAGNPLERSLRCSGDICVFVDRIPGAGNAGLVGYRNGEDVYIYDLFGEELASGTAPSGTYNGAFAANYRVGENGTWVFTVGEMNLGLNVSAGTVSIGGIIPYTPPDGIGSQSIQFFGDATYADGTFTDPDMKILVNNNGTNAFTATGSTTGFFVNGTDGAALHGTVESTEDPTRFLLGGGYTAMHDPRY